MKSMALVQIILGIVTVIGIALTSDTPQDRLLAFGYTFLLVTVSFAVKMHFWKKGLKQKSIGFLMAFSVLNLMAFLLLLYVGMVSLGLESIGVLLGLVSLPLLTILGSVSLQRSLKNGSL